LDQASYAFVQDNLDANDYSTGTSNFVSYLSSFLENSIFPKLSIFQYKDFIKDAITSDNASDALGDARVWSEKEGLRELLNQEEYQKGFSPESFDMTQTNPQVYFLDKILQHQQGKNTLVFLAATNEVLMAEEVNQDGYRQNLQKIDDYFRKKDVIYLNLQGEIEEFSFSDHVHLTAQGYKKLAQRLYEKVTSDW